MIEIEIFSRDGAFDVNIDPSGACIGFHVLVTRDEIQKMKELISATLDRANDAPDGRVGAVEIETA